MRNTQANQEQSSSKYSMPNYSVDRDSATDKPATDQGDPSTKPELDGSIEAIGGAISGARTIEKRVGPDSWWPKSFGNVITDEADARDVFTWHNKDPFVPGASERDKALISEARAVWTNVDVALRDKIEAEYRDQCAASNELERNTKLSTARKERDIVKRARALEMEIQFKDVKKVRQGDMFIPQPQMTDQNKIVVLDALFNGEQEFPHRDHFKGRIIDHEGKVIDDHYPVVRWVEAFAAAGLKGVSTKAAREAIREWALQHERNDLIERVRNRLPEWDHVPRMKNKLIELFGEKDDEFHQNCSQYFWLSLYARVMFPGSLAPMMLSIFGPQGCGKSRFTQTLCKIIMCDPEADTTPLNMAGDPLHLLRAITGRSIIANVGEMTGFTRGDLNKIKDFITRQSDSLNFKYEGELQQPRQWITVMDGNKLDGVFRDDTGERRIILWVCGRQEDEQGKIAYDPDFKVAQNHWDTLEDEVWQIMAECQRWFDENGEKKYEAFVSEVVQQVNAANEKVKAKGNGGISDPVVETFFANTFAATPMVWRETGVACSIPGTEKKTQFYDVPQGVIVYADTFIQTMDRVVGKQKVTSERTKAALFAFAELNGGIIGKFSGKRAGVLFCVGKDVTSVKKRGGRAEAIDQLIADDGSNSILTGDDAIAALKKKFTDDDGSKAAANQADMKHEPF
ncbi:VapE domain-containing protein [Burkholderia anthina]|uniref:VapE domain-containing protein n=1 Tax=Burkholderia anthina TaxID=179879 RepID=UPI001588FC44|nr:VapE domain-containing protein [Burkholderia anthina]